MDIKYYLASQKERVEERLREITDADPGPYRLVKEAMEYSLFAGGKRLRPILCIAANEACGGNTEAALTFGCALEMIHTYTLIHDDLPAMDDDDLRRGKPANHKKYGEDQAILAGCGLLTWAYEVMADAAKTHQIDAAVALRIIAETSHAIGWQGTMGGQSLDMIFTKRSDVSTDELETMEFAKTARLLITAIRNGAILAGADERTLQRLNDFGEKIGLAFQVADDILDVTADEKKLGKPLGSDQRQGKTTYIDRLELDGARKFLHQLQTDAQAFLKPMDERADALRALGDFIAERAY